MHMIVHVHWYSLALYFYSTFTATTFSQIKMYGGDSMREAAEDQLRTCVYGNWRNGMKAMGGGDMRGWIMRGWIGKYG